MRHLHLWCSLNDTDVCCSALLIYCSVRRLFAVIALGSIYPQELVSVFCLPECFNTIVTHTHTSLLQPPGQCVLIQLSIIQVNLGWARQKPGRALSRHALIFTSQFLFLKTHYFGSLFGLLSILVCVGQSSYYPLLNWLAIITRPGPGEGGRQWRGWGGHLTAISILTLTRSEIQDTDRVPGL